MSTPPSSPPPPPPLSFSPQETYSALSTYLFTHRASVLSIELFPSGIPLPPSPSPILTEDLNLALSKKQIIQSFLIARRILLHRPVAEEGRDGFKRGGACEQEEGDGRGGGGGGGGELDGDTDDDDQRTAATILLIYNSEHLTAANWLKRYLQRRLAALQREEGQGQRQEHFDPAITITIPSQPPHHQQKQHQEAQLLIQQELTFSTTLLTSPLPLHTKSPTLWAHRFWLVSNYRRDHFTSLYPQEHKQEKKVQMQEWFLAEVEVVLAAADVHRGNYHAFHYARRLIWFLFENKDKKKKKKNESCWDDCNNKHNSQETETKPPLRNFLNPLTTRLHRFCLSHPSDISGWTFLLFIFRWAHTYKHPLQPLYSLPDKHAVEDLHDDVITRTEGFVSSVGWKGKSVAWFVGEMRAMQEMRIGERMEGRERG
ncbi:hypothetical protein MMC14_000865 [Varicellaria rhodocarpa]|nr:hypothetical protein [Varicellaria rhodocarpa]